MSEELKQAATRAVVAIDGLLYNIRRDAPQLSGKAMGYAENASAELRRALTQRPAAQAGERAAFEAFIRKDCGDLSTFGHGANMHYVNSAVNNAWSGWRARASLPTQPAAQAVEVDERVAFEADDMWLLPFGGPSDSPAPQQATPEPVGEPFKVEQCMQVASDEFDAFLIGGCKGEPPRMSMAFASTLFKTIIRERGMFFTATQPAPGVPEGVRAALEFYASGSHFVLADADAWETVSGEPPNFLEDEANTATVEDGTVARNALAALAAAQAKGADK